MRNGFNMILVSNYLKVNKKELQEWYGKELSSIPNEKELKSLLQAHLSDKNEITKYFEK